MAEHEKLDKDYLFKTAIRMIGEAEGCLLYTSDAADEL